MKKDTSCMESEQVFYFAQGMMEEREAERARRHVAGCAVCRKAVEDYRKLSHALDTWKVGGPSSWFDARLQAAMAAAGEKRRGFFGLPAGRWLAPASLAAMVVFGVVMVYTWRQPTRYSRPVLPSPTRSAQVSIVQRPATAATKPADDEMTLYRDLPMLENYDMLANFDVLSELAEADAKAAD